MKSITIHGIDEPVLKLLKTHARNSGESLNMTVKKMLEKSLGVSSSQTQPHRKDFEAFCGVWGNEEKKDFEKSIADFENIEDSEWK
jgi:hypothetical protein